MQNYFNVQLLTIQQPFVFIQSIWNLLYLGSFFLTPVLKMISIRTTTEIHCGNLKINQQKKKKNANLGWDGWECLSCLQHKANGWRKNDADFHTIPIISFIHRSSYSNHFIPVKVDLEPVPAFLKHVVGIKFRVSVAWAQRAIKSK